MAREVWLVILGGLAGGAAFEVVWLCGGWLIRRLRQEGSADDGE
jgi:hypothetical protein